MLSPLDAHLNERHSALQEKGKLGRFCSVFRQIAPVVPYKIGEGLSGDRPAEPDPEEFGAESMKRLRELGLGILAVCAFSVDRAPCALTRDLDESTRNSFLQRRERRRPLRELHGKILNVGEVVGSVF